MTPENFNLFIDDIVKSNNIKLEREFLHKGLYIEKKMTWGDVINIIKEYEDNFEYCVKILRDCKTDSDVYATLMFIAGTLIRYHHLF